uniref:Uncharacterized protein n=1 Tax=Leersia perrieri TaxID=77586 RepID=A0A0D9X6F3_9ORYZ
MHEHIDDNLAVAHGADVDEVHGLSIALGAERMATTTIVFLGGEKYDIAFDGGCDGEARFRSMWRQVSVKYAA